MLLPLSLWLGWQDLNLRMPESKSGALPLGDIPISSVAEGHTGYYSTVILFLQLFFQIYEKKKFFGCEAEKMPAVGTDLALDFSCTV